MSTAPTRHTLRFVERVALADGRDTSRVQLAVVGTWNHDLYGSLSIARRDLEMMQRNLKEGRRGVRDEHGDWQLNIDYNHGGLSLGPEEAKAAGWLKAPSVVIENGALFGDVEWTPTAAAYIRNKEFQYFSPEIRFHYEDKETGQDIGTVLLAGALTNRPFLEGPAWMSPIILGEGIPRPETPMHQGRPVIFDAAGEGETRRRTGGEKTVRESAVDEQKVRALLGIAGTEPIEEAIRALKERVMALEGEKATLTEKAADLQREMQRDLGLSEFEQVKAQNAQLAERLTQLDAELRLRDCDDAIREALEAGKIVPATEKWARGYFMSDPEGFHRFLESVPPVVPLTETGSGHVPRQQDPAEAFTDRCKQIAAERSIPFADAMVLCEKEEPELFEAYRAARQGSGHRR
jgi:phage I-like protein